MLKILSLVSLVGLTLIMPKVHAATAGCEGVIKGKKIIFHARGSLARTDDGIGIVKIDGRELAHFDGDELNLSYLRRKFSIKNGRGDYVEGQLMNLITGTAVLKRLKIPAYGIDYRNKPVKCWYKH